MKKQLYISSLIVLLFPTLLLAQQMPGDHDISISYGRKSGTEVFHTLTKTPPSLDAPSYNTELSTTGNIFITYRYAITKGVSMGITLGTESFSYDKYSNGRIPNNGLIAHYDATVTTIAFEPVFNYLNTPYVRLYGLFGMGYRVYDQKSNPVQSFDGLGSRFFINSQWTPLGANFGKKQFKGFAEIGLGYKGLINFGFTWKFHSKPLPKENDRK